MSAKSAVSEATNINWRTVGSVVVGMAAFGAILYGVRKLPVNTVTQPIQSGVQIAATR